MIESEISVPASLRHTYISLFLSVGVSDSGFDNPLIGHTIILQSAKKTEDTIGCVGKGHGLVQQPQEIVQIAQIGAER